MAETLGRRWGDAGETLGLPPQTPPSFLQKARPKTPNGSEQVYEESSKSQMESAYLTLEQYLQKECGEESMEKIMNLISHYNSATELYYFSLGLGQGMKLFHT